MKETWKNRLRQLADLPFLAVFTVYLTHLLFQSSTFYLPVPDKFLKNLFLILCLTLLFRIPVYLDALKTQKKVLAAALLLAVNFALVYYFGDHMFLLFSAVLTIGFFGMDYRKVLKLFSVVLGCFLVLTFSAACCGAIEDFVMMKDGYIRTALGICYPTDMASYVLFLLMYSWAAWKRIPDLIALFLGIICFFFSRYIAMSITSTICSAVFCAIVLGHFLCAECGLARRIPHALRTLVRQLMTFAFPLLALLMFVLIFAYSRNFGPALRINNLLSKRLELPLDAFRQYGLKPFGTPFEQNGNGFTTFASNNYNFVDSTYPLILIRYGWILFLALCASWTASTRNAFHNHDSRLACLMALIAFHSLSEHHFIETNFNILLVMPFATLLPLPAVDEHPVKEDIMHSAGILLALSTAAGFCAGILPVFFTWLRTIFQLNQWTGGVWNGFPVLRVLSAMYGSAALVTMGILYMISALRSRKSKTPKRNAAAGIIASAAGFAVLFSLVQAGNNYISRSVSNYSRQLAEEEGALQLITRATSGKVYIDSLPKLYQQKVPGISDSLFLGDELARFYKTSVIMDIKYDSNCFINSGFLFTPISHRHALYTNDPEVISALKGQGYHLTGYYNVRKSVNLKYLSEINQLPYSKKTGLALSGHGQALNFGPYVSLYNGPYTAEYTLQLSGNSAESENIPSDSAVVTLRVSAFNGEKILKEHVLRKDQFDENGVASVNIAFSSGNYPNIEFLAFPENDQDILITSIRYYRSPQYDIHKLYNKKRQNYREEYYTLDGTPVENSEGYIACEYEYDYDGKITEIRYYDAENQPALINRGYASLKRKLDQRGRTILESYFGIDGKPTLCSGSYASVSREYDQDNNVTIEKYFDTSGTPTETTFIYAELHRVYNDQHQVIKESYFDTDGQLLTMPAGYAMIESQYDSSGRPYIQKYLDRNGDPVITASHFAEIHREYTPQNWISKESYYGTDGQPLTLPEGYAMIRRSFDDRGNAVLTEYCDSSGSLIMTSLYYAYVQRRYNERNHLIYEAFFDTSNRPVVMPGNYSAISFERDTVGNATSFKYFDQNGDPAVRTEGYSEVQRYYNDLRLPVREIYLNAEGQPVITIMQYAEVQREYDALRQVIKESFYDTEGKPMRLAEGYSSAAYTNDANGNHIVIKYCDEEGLPVATTGGFSEVHRVYNERQHLLSEKYYDLQGQPTVNTSGFHCVEYERDSMGRRTCCRYFDTAHSPVMISWGYFEEHLSYDSAGTLISQEYFDINRDPVSPPT